jgi:hypothetical protein
VSPALPSTGRETNSSTARAGEEGTSGNTTRPSIDLGTTARDTPGDEPAESRDAVTATEFPVLRIVTVPSGARITVDGVGWGQSPLTIRVLPPGTRRVRATLDGYAAQEHVVNVSNEARRTNVRMVLKPKE